MDLRKHFNPFELIPSIEEDVPEAYQLNMFHEDNPDIGLFNMLDEEIIAKGGSEFYIYKVEIDDNYDKLYEEDRLKKYGSKILVRGHYNPLPIGQELTEFGIKLSNDQIFTFNKSALDAALGREIAAGDIIKPRFQNIVYEVHEVQEEGFAGYGVYHYVASAQVRRDLESELDNTII